jgi:hypothetical protein
MALLVDTPYRKPYCSEVNTSILHVPRFRVCKSLPVVLYGCETWSLTLREERRLRVFENRVLGRVFGPKRDEVTGEWRKLHIEERVVKSRRMRWAGHVACMGRKEVCTGCWCGSLRERDHWGDQDVDGKIILK